jgi:hypothetical protein
LGVPGHVVERPEGAGRKQRVARPPEQTRPSLIYFGETFDQRCLPDPGLTAYEHEAAIACGHVAEQSLQFI